MRKMREKRWLVDGVHGLSTPVGFFILHPVYKYILNIGYTHILYIPFNTDLSSFVCTQLNRLKHFYQTQIILFDINHFCKQLNGFKLCCLTLIILFNVNHLFENSEVVDSIAI